MTSIKALSASDIRTLTRKHAWLFAHLLDTLPCGYDLGFDAAIDATTRLLVEYGPIFSEIVCVGTGLTEAEVQATPWPEVIKIGCEIVEATREAWRPAWQNGFLQGIVSDELRHLSSVARGATR